MRFCQAPSVFRGGAFDGVGGRPCVGGFSNPSWKMCGAIHLYLIIGSIELEPLYVEVGILMLHLDLTIRELGTKLAGMLIVNK